MIWEAIQMAKSEKLNLDVVWLDLTSRQTRGNAYLTGVTTGKFQQIFHIGTATPL